MRTVGLSLFLFLFADWALVGQTTQIELNLQDPVPSFSVSGQKVVQITTISQEYENLVKQYDADPFVTPVIVPDQKMAQGISRALSQYLQNIGLQPVRESENQIHLKVALCGLNYLAGKGWTATVRLDLKVTSDQREIISHTLAGYHESGGGDKEFHFAENALNSALFQAFESVNWETIAAGLSGGTTKVPETSPFSREESFVIQSPGEYYALLIAIEDYRYLNKLDKPVSDANSLMQVLTTSYYFDPEHIIFLKDPTRAEIIDKLDELVYTITPDDNLLIFYAGHGYWDAERETGYWLPVDAGMSGTANWLRNTTIQEYIGDINSKHTLLITDACFGGGIFKTRKAFEDASHAINNIYELVSRKAITSGMLNEVPDKSVFLEYLIRRLAQNDQKYLSSLQLFTSFRLAVMNNSDNVPQYGTIQKTGDEGGDFVFIRR